MSPEDELEEAIRLCIDNARARVRRVFGLVAAGSSVTRAAAWDQQAWRRDVESHVEPVVRRIVRAHAGFAPGPAVAAAVRRQVQRIIGWGDSFANHVDDFLSQQSGGAAEARELIDEWRVLDDYVVGDAAAVEWSAARSAGLVLSAAGRPGLRKRWLTMRDDRVRDSHRALEGVEVPVAASFDVGGYPGEFPHDPSLPDGQRIGCRCHLEVVDRAGRPVKASLAVERFAPARRKSGWKAARAKHGEEAWNRNGPRRPPSLDEALAAGDDVTITAAVDALYGGTWVDDAGRQFTVEVHGFSPQTGKIVTSGVVHHEGRVVGELYRTAVRDESGWRVWHDSLDMDATVQGGGFGTAYAIDCVDRLRTAGVVEVAFEANVDIGGYAWARAGYDFSWSGRSLDDAKGVVGGLVERVAARVEPGDGAALVRLGELRNQVQTAEAYEHLPTPLDIANIGWAGQSGADALWPGKAGLLGSSWIASRRLQSPRMVD